MNSEVRDIIKFEEHYYIYIYTLYFYYALCIYDTDTCQNAVMLQCVAEAIIWAERRAREIGSWLKQHKEVKAHWGAVVLADTQAVWNAICTFQGMGGNR